MQGEPEFQTHLNTYMQEYHPGTVAGFAENLIRHEGCINRLIVEACSERGYMGPKVDVEHKKNNLESKLLFLTGVLVKMQVEGREERQNVRLHRRVVSEELHVILTELRHRRNDEAHARGRIYHILSERFNVFVIQFAEGLFCTFRTNGTTIRFAEVKNEYVGCSGGLYFCRETPVSVDFVLGDVHNHDLVMQLYTKKKAKKFLDFTTSPGVTHVLAIRWCQRVFTFPLNQTCWDWVNEYTGIKNKDSQTMYFRLLVYETLKKIIDAWETRE